MEHLDLIQRFEVYACAAEEVSMTFEARDIEKIFSVLASLEDFLENVNQNDMYTRYENLVRSYQYMMDGKANIELQPPQRLRLKLEPAELT